MKVYGKNVFYETNKNDIKKIYLKRGFKDKQLIKEITDNNIYFEYLNEEFPKGSGGVILEIKEYQYGKLEDIKDDNIVLILDHLTDVHNFGAIIRTAEARGVKNIIIPRDRSADVNEIVYKTSAGAINNINIIKVSNIINSINYLKDNHFFIYSTDMKGTDYRKLSYPPNIAIIIGNEEKGVSPLVLKNSDEIIKIPMKGDINSLNASVAAGIILFGVDNV